jgi:predicted secreted protein
MSHPLAQKLAQIEEKLSDSRSKQVIFISHCLLNENARYFGGAFTAGMYKPTLDQIHAKGIGIIQMPCPEIHAWGGPKKPLLWLGLDIKDQWWYIFSKVILRVFLAHTKRIYRKMAKQVVQEIQNYMNAGIKVVGIVGIDGSPTCGVNWTLDLTRMDMFAQYKLASLDRDAFNGQLYQELAKQTSGLFMAEMQKQLLKQKLDIPILAHDLVREMHGDSQNTLGIPNIEQ